MNSDGGCGVDLGAPSDIGTTAVVGLALLSQGSTPSKGPHAARLRRIHQYILRAVRRMPAYDITRQMGTQLQRKIGRHAHSFFAALFLSQVAGEEGPESESRRWLRKLVTAIVKSQGRNGSWGSESWAPMLGTVMGWVSLRAATSTGLPVRASATRTAKYLIKTMKQQLNANQGWMHNLYKNATGIRVLYAMRQGEQPVARMAFKKVLDLVNGDNTPFNQAGGEEFLSFHLITEVMLQKGGEHWKHWYPVVRDKLVGVQNADGSWTGYHCITSRTFCTAAALLTLQAPYRYLPISDI
jgi:hypothetical protein